MTNTEVTQAQLDAGKDIQKTLDKFLKNPYRGTRSDLNRSIRDYVLRPESEEFAKQLQRLLRCHESANQGSERIKKRITIDLF